MTQPRKIKRPAKVRVGYLTYAILYISDEDWGRRNLPDGLGGMSDHEKATLFIRVTVDRQEDTIRETLNHEILHAVWTHTGLNNQHLMSKTDPDNVEELVVNTISPSLLMVLNDNPNVLAYLLSLGQPA